MHLHSTNIKIYIGDVFSGKEKCFNGPNKKNQVHI